MNSSRKRCKPAIQLVQGVFRALLVERGQRGGLRAMKQHEGPVLLVREGPFLVGRVLAHEVHEAQRVVGVGRRAAKFPQRQPAHPAVIKLHELAVGLGALLGRQLEVARPTWPPR